MVPFPVPEDLTNQLMGEITACFTGKLVVITDREPSGKQKKKSKKREASIAGTAETKRADVTVIQSTLQSSPNGE